MVNKMTFYSISKHLNNNSKFFYRLSVLSGAYRANFSLGRESEVVNNCVK